MRNNFRNRIRSKRSRLLLDLESHVVSIRDCLQCLFNRFHTSPGNETLELTKRPFHMNFYRRIILHLFIKFTQIYA